eukprot:GGOE01005697.1.p1 GENE.GGOE01005697.1~~GGOE01005697.1.p1  ORF type:complete len:118 (+),score=4.12 GGOE01005697.1:229-582(+)
MSTKRHRTGRRVRRYEGREATWGRHHRDGQNVDTARRTARNEPTMPSGVQGVRSQESDAGQAGRMNFSAYRLWISLVDPLSSWVYVTTSPSAFTSVTSAGDHCPFDRITSTRSCSLY